MDGCTSNCDVLAVGEPKRSSSHDKGSSSFAWLEQAGGPFCVLQVSTALILEQGPSFNPQGFGDSLN